jgi:hypothetical protein
LRSGGDPDRLQVTHKVHTTVMQRKATNILTR